MRLLVVFFILILFCFSCDREEKNIEKPIYIAGDWENPEWENPEIFQINREAPTASFYRYTSKEKALKNNSWQNSSSYKSLNGIWQFYYADSIQARPIFFYKNQFSTKGWDTINVPSNWELEGFGIPVYSNIKYMFPANPPKIQHNLNNVGTYKRTFKVDKSWTEKEVFLHFAGVSGAMYVYINEDFIGYNEGSKTPAEYNISKFLKQGVNTISVQVLRWSDASYLEDQDFWRLSGMERDVYLYTTNKLRIHDVSIKSTLINDYKNGNLEVDVVIKNSSKGPQELPLNLKLLKEGKIVYQKNKEAKLNSDKLSIKFKEILKSIKPWTAESPNLYTLLIEFNG